jgi:hypothetical protein
MRYPFQITKARAIPEAGNTGVLNPGGRARLAPKRPVKKKTKGRIITRHTSCSRRVGGLESILIKLVELKVSSVLILLIVTISVP